MTHNSSQAAIAIGSIAIFFLTLAIPAHGLGFKDVQDCKVGHNPSSVATGDFNRDGKPDLAVTNYGSNSVSVLRGNGDGTFQPAVNYGGLSSPAAVTVVDLNGDRKLDLAVANLGNSTVAILL